ncbi:MAG: nuclear transport factor 2 family protein [Chloroflexota bacterium]|nr:nuclear transport factor 2 family protein [Chloroflexota bacterium]
MPSTTRELFTRFVTAMAERDMAALEQVIDPDFVGEYPQSGERFRGFSAFRAQLEAYPGGLPRGNASMGDARLVDDEERWAITPGYTVLPLAGPQRFTAVVRTTYPDGSHWHIVSIIEIRDDRIARSTTYFAPEFDPPEWRRPLVEIVPRGQLAE